MRISWKAFVVLFWVGCLTSSAWASVAVYANSFKDLEQVLTEGRPVTALVDLSQCKNPVNSKPGPAIERGVPLSSFTLHQGLYLSFLGQSENSQVPMNMLAQTTSRYRVLTSGAIQIEEFAPRGDGGAPSLMGTLFCRIGQGVRFVWQL